MGITAACYTMHICCDNEPTRQNGRRMTMTDWEYEHTRNTEWMYTGQSLAECKRKAIRQGWRIRRDDGAICPACTRMTKETGGV